MGSTDAKAGKWYPCKDIEMKAFHDVRCTAPNHKLQLGLRAPGHFFNAAKLASMNKCMADTKGSFQVRCNSEGMLFTRYMGNEECSYTDTPREDQHHKFWKYGQCMQWKTKIA